MPRVQKSVSAKIVNLSILCFKFYASLATHIHSGNYDLNHEEGTLYTVQYRDNLS